MAPKKDQSEVTPAQPVEQAPKQTPTKTETTSPHQDNTDVEAALARKTQDGKGEDEVPPADFDSFATEGVESNVDELANQVLRGVWGYNRREALRKLREAGHDSDAVDDKLQELLDRGAPTSLVK